MNVANPDPRSERLRRLVRKRRYALESRACLAVLESVGISVLESTALELDHAEAIFARYVDRLREGPSQLTRYSADEGSSVQRQLDDLALGLDDMPVVWLAKAPHDLVALDVAAGPMLRAATAYFVTRPSGPDLMLSSRDTNHGICIAFDHLPSGDEYEIRAWGAFAP